jgi:hypothetical protein
VPEAELTGAQRAELAVLALPPACEDRPRRAEQLRARVARGDVRGALREAERHARNYPTDPRTWLALAELRCVYERQYGRARSLLRAALEAHAICALQLGAIEQSGGHPFGAGPSQRLAMQRVHVCLSVHPQFP